LPDIFSPPESPQVNTVSAAGFSPLKVDWPWCELSFAVRNQKRPLSNDHFFFPISFLPNQRRCCFFLFFHSFFHLALVVVSFSFIYYFLLCCLLSSSLCSLLSIRFTGVLEVSAPTSLAGLAVTLAVCEADFDDILAVSLFLIIL
jgi:hypothetical protein